MPSLRPSLRPPSTPTQMPIASVRFVAVSATIPNVRDIAEWLQVPPQGLKVGRARGRAGAGEGEGGEGAWGQAGVNPPTMQALSFLRIIIAGLWTGA